MSINARDNIITGGGLSNSVTTRGRARVRAYAREDGAIQLHHLDGELDQLAAYYRDTFGSYCPACARREMEEALDRGIFPDVIMICLDEAAAAPRPSWAYARAILRRCIAEGIHTAEDYGQGQIRYYARGGKKSRELPF